MALFKLDKTSTKTVDNTPKNKVTQTIIALQHNSAEAIGKSLFSGNMQFYKKGSLSVGVGSVRNSSRKMGRT